MSEHDTINGKTISRLFHQVAFKNGDTRLSEKSLQLSSQYIRLFINEAIQRSNDERVAEGDSIYKVDGIDNIDRNEADVAEERAPDTTFTEENTMDQEGDQEEEEEEEEELPSNPNSQYNNEPNGTDLGTDTIDTRHLSKVAGVLLLDF